MASIKEKLDKIRKSEGTVSWPEEMAWSIGIIVVGLLTGVLQKWMDGTASNELPFIFQQIDIVNYFGRLAIWILIATVISVTASTPLRASVNTFLFFISMIAGYYAYSRFVLGFLPMSYMMMWIAVAFASIIPAYICWYAKGEGIPAVIISAGILGVLLAQAVILTQGIYIVHMTEVVTWLIGAAILYRKPKEFAAAMLLSVPVAVIYQMFIPYYG